MECTYEVVKYQYNSQACMYGHFVRTVQFIAWAHSHFSMESFVVLVFSCSRDTCDVSLWKNTSSAPLCKSWWKATLETLLTPIWFLVSRRKTAEGFTINNKVSLALGLWDIGNTQHNIRDGIVLSRIRTRSGTVKASQACVLSVSLPVLSLLTSAFHQLWGFQQKYSGICK